VYCIKIRVEHCLLEEHLAITEHVELFDAEIPFAVLEAYLVHRALRCVSKQK